MTVLTVSAVAVVATGGAAVPAALAANAALGASGAATGAAAGAVTGAAAAASAGAGAAGLGTAAGILSGPIGWLVLGATHTSTSCTYDCWKPVLHDQSSDLSNGKLLREVIMDSRIKKATTITSDSTYPQLILQNIWDEQFLIQYVLLPSNDLAAHAVKL